ncbi:hypothetical protein [Candidatus Nitrosocosmicus hydrocola]|uniref:hypothetical protein n=1 Tax=Candidatus Nitrosocosmicus hydrocola TaxID=1826872 RepID=UPI0011E5E6D6|nr:hypothetical protein [Candidatus Nitrosocosmicus hydrocola]
MREEIIFVHKAIPRQHLGEDTPFVIYSPQNSHHKYGVIHDIFSIIDLIRRHIPAQIIINCISLHARDIVKFIFHIQNMKMYKLSVKRVVYKYETEQRMIIILKYNSKT